MTAFAIIETGGKQYRVSAGNTLKVEKLEVAPGKAVVFDRVLLRSQGDQVDIGAPYIAGAKVEGKVLSEGRSKKKIIFRYHSKTRYRKKRGHRQPYTQIEITKI